MQIRYLLLPSASMTQSVIQIYSTLYRNGCRVPEKGKSMLTRGAPFPARQGLHCNPDNAERKRSPLFVLLQPQGLEDLVTCHATCSVQCECGAGSETNEKLNTITIDCDPLDEALRLGTVLSLEHKLRSYTSKVCQSDEDMWDCSQCHKRKPPIHQVS